MSPEDPLPAHARTRARGGHALSVCDPKDQAGSASEGVGEPHLERGGQTGHTP